MILGYNYLNIIFDGFKKIMSFIWGLIVGCGLGAISHAYFQNYKNNKKDTEHMLAQKNEDIALLFDDHPYLMNLLKSNLSDPEYKNIDEFFVVDKLAIMNSSIPRLRYDLSDEMLSLLEKLEQLDYIEQLEHDSLLYRMDREFIEDLNSFHLSRFKQSP